jgi:hypothetical protein
MSDNVSFLARWSRRKRGADPKTRDQPKPDGAAGTAASEASAAAVLRDETQPIVDPASLPSIGSIGAGSDVRAFLASGVPADLTRAALRRAWSVDGRIRDFVGLSENSWDFNAPGGVPGFGAVKAEDLRRLLAQVMGEQEAADPARAMGETLSADQPTVPVSKSGPAAALTRRQPATHDSAQDQLNQDHDTGIDRRDSASEGKATAATNEAGERKYPSLPRRGHGGALPE